MSFYLGCVLVDQTADAPLATWPLPTPYGFQDTLTPQIATHQFGSGDGKITQRYYLGYGKEVYTIPLGTMSPQRRKLLVDFWNQLGGPQNAFTYNVPLPASPGQTFPITCIFDPEQALNWTQASDLIANATVRLIPLTPWPTEGPYAVANTVTRFPSSTLAASLLQQVQNCVPLVTITPHNWQNLQDTITGTQTTLTWTSNSATHCSLYLGNPLNPAGTATLLATGGSTGTYAVPPAQQNPGLEYTLLDSDTHRLIAARTRNDTAPIYVSDRTCQVGNQVYYGRLLGHQGISQKLGPADDATLQFANADRVFTRLKGLVHLLRADVRFDIYHVPTQTLIQLWRGEVKSWSSDEKAVFSVACSDSIYELTLPYPNRTITRDCYKQFNDGTLCPYRAAGSGGNPGYCDKGFDTLNGCQSHGMDNYFGGVIANPQGVQVRDNGSSGRPTITATSIASDTMYGRTLQEVYTNIEMPVNCIIADGRDESDFYEAVGIVGAGPIGSFGSVQNQLLDGQTNNFPFPPSYCLGHDPEPTPLSLTAGGKYQYPYKAAGVARLNIRRTDPKGIQPSSPDSHQMVATVSQGMSGIAWTAPGNAYYTVLTNPIWVAVNAILRAKGIGWGQGNLAQQEAAIDVPSAVAAAAICNLQVPTLVYNRNPVQLPVDGANAGLHQWTPFTPTQPQMPTETQFQFIGMLGKDGAFPLRDTLDQILLNCSGYWFTVYGKIFFGIRENAGAAEAFTLGNMLYQSYSEQPRTPQYNDLTATFADRDFNFAQNTARYYDQDNCVALGGGTPRYEKGQINFAGTVTASQALRLSATRCREEIGGINEFEWKNAVEATWKTTLLSLNVAPGQVVSVTHPDIADGYGKFRITGWTLNYDYSITLTGSTVTDSMYDLEYGPKPQDVQPPWLPIVPNIVTNSLADWQPAINPIPYGYPIGFPGQSTFAVSANYTPDTAGNLNVQVVVSGSAPTVTFWTQNRPKIGKMVTGAGVGTTLPGGKTYYFTICALSSTGTWSPPSVMAKVLLGANENYFEARNLTFPTGSAGYISFVGTTPSNLHMYYVGSDLPTQTGVYASPVAGLIGPPPDQWQNVRILVKAKKVVRLGRLRGVVAAVDAARGLIMLQPGDIQSYEIPGGIVSVLGDPQGGLLSATHYAAGTWFPGTSQLQLLVPGGNNVAVNPAIRPGQIVVFRTGADIISGGFGGTSGTTSFIGSSSWISSQLPGGLPMNGDAGRYVRIIGGAGVGQVRQVVSNTATTHTVSPPWDTNPNNTSIYIVEEADYLWESDSPVLANSDPNYQISIPLSLPNVSEVSGLLLVAVLEANGFESDEYSAPFRDLALLSQVDITPNAGPWQGTWWVAPGYEEFSGWMEANPYVLTGTTTISWQSYLSGSTTLHLDEAGPVVASSPGPSGSATLTLDGNHLLTLYDQSGARLAHIFPGYPPYPATNPPNAIYRSLYPAVNGGPAPWGANQTSTDTVINYSTNPAFKDSVPLPSRVPSRYFYARFTGGVWVETSGIYTVGVNGDDGCNLWVNGNLVISQIGLTTPGAADRNYTVSTQLYLAAGRSYPVILEYHQMGGAAVIQLLWTPPGQPTELMPAGQVPTVSTSTPFNTQGSIAPAQSFQISVSAKTLNPDGSWNFAISWSAGAIIRADQSTVAVAGGAMTWANLHGSSAYVYPYVLSNTVHIASGDAPATPPTTPSDRYTMACYYDGRIPMTPFVVTAPVSAPTAESGSITASPNAVLADSNSAVTLNWGSSGAGSVSLLMGSPTSGTQLATGASGTFTTGPYVNPGTGFYVVDTADSVVLASVLIGQSGDAAQPIGGGYGPGSQGGDGVCPEENCRVYVADLGVIRAGDAKVGAWIRGRQRGCAEPVYRQITSIRRKYSVVWNEVAGERVSPQHEVSFPDQPDRWLKPFRIGPANSDPGWRIEITVDARHWEEHNFDIVDEFGVTKFIMHNYLVSAC